MKITVRIANQFGRKDIYPVDQQAKDVLAKLSRAKRKVFSTKQIEFIKAIGVEVEVQAPALDSEKENNHD